MIPSIQAISPIARSANASSIGGIDDLLSAGNVAGSGSSSDITSGFGDALANALNSLDASAANVDQLAQGVATGDVSAAEYVTAATEAQMLVQLTVQVRNRAVEAFNEIMRMQV